MRITDEEYQEIKNTYIEDLKTLLISEGGIYPHITIFADHKEVSDDKKTAIVHIPIPGEYMVDDETKDEFVTDIMPSIFKSVKERFKPYGIGWASEASIRATDKEFDYTKEDYKKLPIKKEVLIITIETENKLDVFFYEIKRKGTQVNSDGKYTHRIELTFLENMSKLSNSVGGRFSGLYKKLNKHEPI
jgi:hypothetical protein